MRLRRRTVIRSALAMLVVAAIVVVSVPALWARALRVVRPRSDVAGRLGEFGAAARERLRPGFERAGAAYPARFVVVAVFKRERRLEAYAPDGSGAMRRVYTCPVLGASGREGPKLRAGDLQVPEGEYAVESLNPNSLYHVALRVAYPSREDRDRGAEDGRERLGGDIMIHGGAGSIGCIAIGDRAAEDLFTLAADTGIAGVTLLLCPADWRASGTEASLAGQPPWLADRYERLRRRLEGLEPAGDNPG